MKKVVFITVIIIATGAVLFFSCTPAKKKETAVAAPIINEYPNMRLTWPDGSVRSARDLPSKSVLVIYLPDCDHCQREATEISSHLNDFKNYLVLFISNASFEDIEKFAIKYKLAGNDNVHFVRTEAEDIFNNLGGIDTPSVYIYSQNKKLVKAFNGETKIEEIIKHL